jgi:hypothetical protein
LALEFLLHCLLHGAPPCGRNRGAAREPIKA